MNLKKLCSSSLVVALFGTFIGVAAADPKPDISDIEAGPIAVEAKPITSFKRFSADEPLAKLRFRGGLVLTSPSPQFGGWSGLVVDDDARSFLSISDTGVWMTGELAYDGTHPAGIKDARLGPLLERTGFPLQRGRNRDSEIDCA